MRDLTVAAMPHEWQRSANDLLGANLVGDVCGKKTLKQAYRWAREPDADEAQNGPLAHVLAVCDRLLEAGQEGREAAVDALRILATHLSARGVGVRVARDCREPGPWSASMASQRLGRAVSDAIQAGVENRPPELVAAHVEYLFQLCLDYQTVYAREFDRARKNGGAVRFRAEDGLDESASATRSGRAARGGGGWAALFGGLRKRVFG